MNMIGAQLVHLSETRCNVLQLERMDQTMADRVDAIIGEERKAGW
jgi:hypothetical protein